MRPSPSRVASAWLSKHADNQEAVRAEVERLLTTAHLGPGEELDELAAKLKAGEPLTAREIEDYVAAAEKRLEDAEYEVRTNKIPEHKADNREDRDHYRKVLQAVKKLKPTQE